jgi:ABC-type branched-subunit amino acid transport system substrate-binding protein
MRVTKILCALAAGALVLSACGSKDDGGGGSTAAGLTGDPIKIGQIAPTGTSFYNAPDSVAVAKAAVRGVNERGGVNGRPLEIDYCNDEGDPNKAAACARQMVADGVVAVVRSITIAGGDQVAAILQAAGIPDVGRGALVPAEFNAPNYYLLDGGVLSAYAGVLQQFAADGGKKVFFAATEGASASTTLSTLQRMADELKLTVAGTATIPTNTADYTPFVANIQQSGAEGAVLAFPEQPILQTVKTADQSGLQIKWLLNGGGITEADLAALPAPQTANFVVGTGTLQLSAADDNDTVEQMKEDIEAQFTAGDKDADPTKLFSTSLLAWESVHVLAGLMADLDTVDAKSITTALNDAKDIDLGISAPWTPSRPGPQNFSRLSHPFVHLNKVADGQLVAMSADPLDVGDLLE